LINTIFGTISPSPHPFNPVNPVRTFFFMKLNPQEIEKRLKEAEKKSFMALAFCIACPLVYYALIYYFREPILDYLVQFPGMKSGGGLAALIILAPFLAFPVIYRWLGERIAASVGLECPECKKCITSDRDWRITLFTGRCPHCQNYVVASSSATAHPPPTAIIESNHGQPIQ
jgi:hypothetical protein